MVECCRGEDADDGYENREVAARLALQPIRDRESDESAGTHVLVIVQVDAGLEEIPFCLDCATWLFRRRKKASILPFRGARRVETAAGRPGRRS